MKRFPAAVGAAMRERGADATCLAVQLDDEAWEAAMFLRLAGEECREDRRRLRHSSGNIPVGLEADVIEHASAAVVVLRLETHTGGAAPLHFEILLTPGATSSHFDTLKLLASQPRLCWFFADERGDLLHAQQHPLEAGHHDGFESVLSDALRHDRLVRLTGRYDAGAALAEVASHYQPRSGAASDGITPA